MIKIKIISVGKNKEKWLEQALDEYIKRLQTTITIDCQWVPSDTHLETLAKKEKHLICLDPNGKMMDSETFATFFQNELERSGARLSFVIGGPDGLPAVLKQTYPLISLSKLTFTHQLSRLILLEQIYRATEILKGSKYHRG